MELTPLSTSQKLRILLSATVTDYSPAWTNSRLPTELQVIDLSKRDLEKYSFLPHNEIPVFNVEDEPATEPAVCCYEAARNSGSIAGHFDELCRKAHNQRGYMARKLLRNKQQPPVEARRGRKPPTLPPPKLDQEKAEGYKNLNAHQRLKPAPAGQQPPGSHTLTTAIEDSFRELEGNRFQALAELEACQHLAETSCVSFAQMRDSPWRARPTRKRGLPRRKYRFHQEVSLADTLPAQTTQDTVVSNGLILYTPPRTGKTRYLAHSKQTILQLSDRQTSDPETLASILSAGYIVATSNPTVLTTTHPVIAMFPGEASPQLTLREGNCIAFTHVKDYELVFHSLLVSQVCRYE